MKLQPISSSVRTLEQVKRDHVVAVLRECSGDKTHAARLLGISRRSIDLMLNRWGIDRAWRKGAA